MGERQLPNGKGGYLRKQEPRNDKGRRINPGNQQARKEDKPFQCCFVVFLGSWLPDFSCFSPFLRSFLLNPV
jgi:hypothetical protein